MKSFKEYLTEAKDSFKKGDKVEIGHADVNKSRGEVSFAGDTTVGKIVDVKNGKALVHDADGDTEWREFSTIRKVGNEIT